MENHAGFLHFSLWHVVIIVIFLNYISFESLKTQNAYCEKPFGNRHCLSVETNGYS